MMISICWCACSVCGLLVPWEVIQLGVETFVIPACQMGTLEDAIQGQHSSNGRHDKAITSGLYHPYVINHFLMASLASPSGVIGLSVRQISSCRSFQDIFFAICPLTPRKLGCSLSTRQPVLSLWNISISSCTPVIPT